MPGTRRTASIASSRNRNAVALSLYRLPVSLDLQGHEAGWFNAERHREQLLHAAQQQPGRDEQHERERNFGDDQQAASAAPGGLPRRRLQIALELVA